MPTRYFEDLREGEQVECRPFSLTHEAIVAFAREYDPQPFHLDDAAAGYSVFGGIVASGVHTLACCTRAVVDALHDVAIVGGVGMDAIHARNPVRPGDEVRLTGRWEDLRRTSRDPRRGLATLRCHAVNQRGETVVEYAYRYLVAAREAPSSAERAPA